MSIKDGILDLTIQKHWFNEIKQGRKIHEYRNFESWKNKLSKPENYKTVRFRLGQTTKATDSTKVLYGKILSITEKNGKDTDLKIDELVYDIEFKLLQPHCLAIDCVFCSVTDCENLKNRGEL